jgi:hypothetical protein
MSLITYINVNYTSSLRLLVTVTPKLVVDRIRGSGLEGFWQFLRETERARAVGHGLELLKNADTRHYTQFLEE